MFRKPLELFLCLLPLLMFVAVCMGEFWEYQGLQSRSQCSQAGCAKSCSCLVFKPRNCLDILHNGCDVDGVYKVFPDYQSRNFRRGIDVYCDQSTEGGGWTVFQRRINGSVNFDRNWLEYKYGFGNLDGEFWLGNEFLHLMSSDYPENSLRIEMETTENITMVANYQGFSVGPEIGHYALLTQKYHGDAGNPFPNLLHTGFSTDDRDLYEPHHYPFKYGGGWWYYKYNTNNMNGRLDFSQNYYLKWMPKGTKLKRTELKFQ